MGVQCEMLVYEVFFSDCVDKVNGIVGILLDMIECKEMEDEFCKVKEVVDVMSQVKGDFLVNMSYEI